MKLLQWNVWYKEQPDNLVKQLREIDADIICGQEFFQKPNEHIDTAKYIAEELGYYYFFKESASWKNHPVKGTITQGNAIFSKYPISDTHYTYLRDFTINPIDALHEGRLYIEITVNINNKPLTIGTAHLTYSAHFEIIPEKKVEADNLLNILKTKQESFIFTGDLNSVPDSSTIVEINKLLVNAGPNFHEKTWPTKPFDYQDFHEEKLNWRIDYIFHTKDVHITSAKIVTTPYSDHLPILAEITI